jgi:hypothetical protein
MKDFRASQATLDKQQEDLVRRMQVFKQYRGPRPAASRRRGDAENAISLRCRTFTGNFRSGSPTRRRARAAPIRARLEETLTQLKAQRHIEKVSIVSPAPADDARTIDLTRRSDSRRGRAGAACRDPQQRLLDRDALREVAGLVDVVALASAIA